MSDEELLLFNDIYNRTQHFGRTQFVREIMKLQQENQKLKKQLEEANEKILLLQASEPMLEYKKALEENQQKEFIEYLENEKNIYPYDISDYTYEDIINTILSKYYEIIEK